MTTLTNFEIRLPVGAILNLVWVILYMCNWCIFTGKTGGRATLLVGAAIEAGCVAYDINKAKKAKKEGRLSDRDYEDVVGKRVAVAVGDVSLSTVGEWITLWC